MKISIIIPVYNVAQYVEQCIQSVLCQDYEDIEIIIVDDCSSDNSVELVRKTIAVTTRTVYILEHATNRGASAARNTGIRQAAGEYIYFLDSDDYIEPDCISSLVKKAQRYPNAEILIGTSKAVPEKKLLDNMLDMTDLKDYYDDRREIKRLMLNTDSYPYWVWNKLIKREWLLKYKLFMREGIINEDLHWTFYTAKYTKEIALLKRVIHYYRRVPTGVTESAQIPKIAESMYVIVKDWMGNIDNQCFSAQLRIISFYLNYLRHLLQEYYVMKYGGGNRPVFIRMFYPLIYLPMFIFNKNKIFR